MSKSSQSHPRRVLLLANEFVAQYRGMRCIAMTGAEVHVMGPEKTRALALSRFCAAYHPFFFGHEAYLGIDAPVDPRMAAAVIDAVARAHGIEMIFAGDALTTRLLCAMQPHLDTPSFPVPDVETFDALATKDAFMAFCREHDLLHPQGQMFDDVEEVRAAIVDGAVRFPAMLKPVNRAGSIGVMRVDATNAQAAVARIDYAPILVQDFVDGEDRCITVFAKEGAVLKDVVYWHPGGVFHFGEEPEISRLVANIARELNLTGIFNFDTRIGTDGRVWLIECNPRFFFNMDVAAVAGMNFAALDDLTGHRVALSHGDMRVPEASLKWMLAGKLPTAADRKMLRHWLADPFIFLLISLGFPRRWRSEWLERFGAKWRKPVSFPKDVIQSSKVGNQTRHRAF